MKKIIPLTIAVLLTSSVALSASPALAANRAETAAQNANKRQEIREAVKIEVVENSQMRQETRQESRVMRQEDRQDILQERRDDIAKRHADRLTIRFDLYYGRLSTILNKIEARFAQLSADGKNTSTAQAKLEEAKTALASAKSYSDQAIAGFVAIDPADYQSQRTQALAARDLANKAREQFRIAVVLMKEAVELAKSIQ